MKAQTSIRIEDIACMPREEAIAEAKSKVRDAILKTGYHCIGLVFEDSLAGKWTQREGSSYERAAEVAALLAGDFKENIISYEYSAEKPDMIRFIIT